MSAYIVSHDHIDAILTVAAEGPMGRYPGDNTGSVSWLRSDPEEVSWREYEWAEITRCPAPGHLTTIGRMLLEECERSVAFRYPNDTPEELPGYGERAADYEYRRVSGLDTRAETGLGLVACLRYQSCEHPGWRRSEAYRFCEAFEAAMIRRLPGLEDAPWHYRREGVAA